MRRERKPSRMRSLLWFLLGGLLGANLVYFVMSRDGASGGMIGGMTGGEPSARSGAEARKPALPLRYPWRKSNQPEAKPVLPPPVVRIPDGPTGGALVLPVQGIAPSQLVDTFTDSRSEGRSHDAIDIMAPHGTPVLAVADGRVEKLFTSKQGGLTLYQFNRERTHAYYYAHLQGYAAGIAEQRDLKRGEVLGYVGVTGNSNPDGPHLHFAIFELGPEKQWWKGTPINPYGLLGGRSAALAAQQN